MNHPTRSACWRLIRVALTTAMIATVCIGVGCGPKDREQKVLAPGKRPPAPPPPRQVPIDQALRHKALEELEAARRSNDPVQRANAIEGYRLTGAGDVGAHVVDALADPSPLVRKAGALAAGELRLVEAYEPILAVVADDEPAVQIAARFALHRLGDTRFSQQLVQFARHPQARIRAETALVLGLLAEASAKKILDLLRRDVEPAVRLQAAEAMWRLGSREALEDLVAATLSIYPDDQMIALIALAGPRDRRVIEHIRAALTADHVEVTLVAARAVGQLGSDSGYTLAINAVDSADPRQRSLAALALGAIRRADAQPALAKLLADKVPQVRLAAAVAVLQLPLSD